MSTYMSEALVGKINLDALDNNLLAININDQLLKIKEISTFCSSATIEFDASPAIAYYFFNKDVNPKNIKLNWIPEKIIDSYSVISLMFKLENNIDMYIIKLQINFEV